MTAPETTTQDDLLNRYDDALLGVFGSPKRALVRGEGVHVWDADGRRYLDLLGGIAVNSLGHGHPDLVAAVREQAGLLLHVSNFFTTPAQVALAERLLALTEAPAGSAVFLTNSGTETVEAAIKLARRTGRTGIVAAEGAFHGRSTGALALTSKPAHREPFEPLMPGVHRVPFGDAEALERALGDHVGALVLEPIQGEGGVVPATADYLRRARELTERAGVLLVLDEIQTGVGRTGSWFAYQKAGITPDVVLLAKGLAGGLPIGAMITFGERVSGLLSAGQHGTTFGGNPLAAHAAVTVLDVIERDGLVEAAAKLGREFRSWIDELDDPRIVEVRGEGLLIGVQLARPVAAELADAALAEGIIVNPVRPDTIRLAPPLIIGVEDLSAFLEALPGLLDRVGG